MPVNPNASLAALPTFEPPLYMRNPHIQASLSSSGLRGWFLQRRLQQLLASAEPLTIDAGCGVTLMGEYNRALSDTQAPSLIVMLHGWEGSSKSNYIVSACASLLAAGFDVLRLNFRDHGDTHHLNRGIFNSTLIEEVAGAIARIQKDYRYHHTGLLGFSLGGNFGLRVSLLTQILRHPMDAVMAVCPVLNPAHTMQALEQSPWYESYFVRKWKRSLSKKLRFFPHYDFGNALQQMTRLQEMNEYFIPKYTPFSNVEEYFAAYTITGQTLSFTRSPTLVLSSADDPVIPADDLNHIARPASIKISIQTFGSHCAFLQSVREPSWADVQATAFFETYLPGG